MNPTHPLTPIPFGSDEWKALRARVAGDCDATRVCDGCGERFRPLNGRNRQCSPKCYMRVRRNYRTKWNGVAA